MCVHTCSSVMRCALCRSGATCGRSYATCVHFVARCACAHAPAHRLGVDMHAHAWRDLVPRSLQEGSDVWAFGVLCWEVFTDAKIPYLERSNDDDVRWVVARKNTNVCTHTTTARLHILLASTITPWGGGHCGEPPQ